MILTKLSQYLPPRLRTFVKTKYYRGRHPIHPLLKEVGSVQDLYYWTHDENLDTLLVLQNYFSALYTGLDTNTKGIISLYKKDGVFLGSKSFELVQNGAAKLRVSTLLQELEISPEPSYGTLQVKIEIPREILKDIQDRQPFYFWDRFYIGYVNRVGQTCFTHGVDKTHIYREGVSTAWDWYELPGNHKWAPEIPVDINDYSKFSVVMINRTSRITTTTLTVSDSDDNSLSCESEIPPKGVHRFELDKEVTADLNPNEMRMLVTGMATQFGRPVVFKEFPNGSISAMHC